MFAADEGEHDLVVKLGVNLRHYLCDVLPQKCSPFIPEQFLHMGVGVQDHAYVVAYSV